LLCSVFSQNPFRKHFAQQGTVGGGLFERAFNGSPKNVVLVLELDKGQCRIIGIAEAGMRVHVVEHINSKRYAKLLQVGRKIDQTNS
jgi:hypothetical protein